MSWRSALQRNRRAAALDAALVDAITDWMTEPAAPPRLRPRHDLYIISWKQGNAQGIARAIAIHRGITFNQVWEAGLNAYQNQVCTGKPYLAEQPEPNPPGVWDEH